MKRIFLILTIAVFFLKANCQVQKHTPFYGKQVAFEFGVGDNTGAGTEFPFCSSLGGYLRNQNHVYGIRRDYHTQLEIFQKSRYYSFRDLFYGYSFVKKNTILTPQFGVGAFETNHTKNQSLYQGMGVELSMDCLWNARGNGVGLRFYWMYSTQANFVGFSLHGTLGWQWEKAVN